MATRLAHGYKPADPFDASAPPLYQTATFVQPDAVSNGEYDYTRSGNPTRDLLQEQWASLEGADAAYEPWHCWSYYHQEGQEEIDREWSALRRQLYNYPSVGRSFSYSYPGSIGPH